MDEFPGLPARLDVPPGNRPALELRLDPRLAGTLEVAVRTPDGKPLGKATEIIVFGPPSASKVPGYRLMRRGGMRTAWTDSVGGAARFLLPPGTYEVSEAAPRRGEGTREQVQVLGGQTSRVHLEAR